MPEVLHRMQIFQWNEQFIIIGQWENVCIIIPRLIVRVLLLPEPGLKVPKRSYFIVFLSHFFLSLQNNDFSLFFFFFNSLGSLYRSFTWLTSLDEADWNIFTESTGLHYKTFYDRS